MSLQQFEIISWEKLEDYHYDNIKIEIPHANIDELQENFTINGVRLKDFLSAKSKYIEIMPGKLVINVKDMFGEIKFSNGKMEKKVKIIPSKIFQNLSPKEAYFFIKNKVFTDIMNFLSFIVKDYKDLQMLEHLEIVKKDFERSLDYIIIFLEKIISSCKPLLQDLFASGPVHKEILIQKFLFGTKISLTPKNIIAPYKFYYKQTHTFDTLLNQMVFQTLYFVLQECNYLNDIINLEENEKRKRELSIKINEISKVASFLIDKYQLWCFFNDKPLDFSELSNKIISQSNFSYKKIFEIYKEIVKILFSRTILSNIIEGIEFPIQNFEYIYELWAISSFYNLLSEQCEQRVGYKGYYKKRKVKMKIEFVDKSHKKSFLIYEIKFDPSIDSLYFEKLVINKRYFNIKPDILIILEGKKNRKIFLGDIKFSKDEEIELPRLRDLYKVLGYLIDLSEKSEIFKNEMVEGILVFPGFIDSIRIPKIHKNGKNKKTYYINVIPLNHKTNQISMIQNKIYKK
ncbi:MAG: hypothetical protein OH354_04660 [Candidatus Parvarchaeota archaeon]|nr:hypothetical protein [Candidatus Jingweiarchaeum tengchongense]